MLILTRKPGESIRIGDDIVIFVKSISGKTVRLGITAPQSIPVYREELLAPKTTKSQDAPTTRSQKNGKSSKDSTSPIPSPTEFNQDIVLSLDNDS